MATRAYQIKNYIYNNYGYILNMMDRRFLIQLLSISELQEEINFQIEQLGTQGFQFFDLSLLSEQTDTKEAITSLLRVYDVYPNSNSDSLITAIIQYFNTHVIHAPDITELHNYYDDIPLLYLNELLLLRKVSKIDDLYELDSNDTSWINRPPFFNMFHTYLYLNTFILIYSK